MQMVRGRAAERSNDVCPMHLILTSSRKNSIQEEFYYSNDLRRAATIQSYQRSLIHKQEILLRTKLSGRKGVEMLHSFRKDATRMYAGVTSNLSIKQKVWNEQLFLDHTGSVT